MIVVAVLAVLFVVYLIIDNPLGTLIFILFAVLLCAAVALLPGISEKRNRVLKIEKNKNSTSREELLVLVSSEMERVDAMTGAEFENFIVEILKCNGYKNVVQTKLSGDYGIDVLAQKGEKKYAFQCKRFVKKLGLKPIQEAYAGKQHYKADEAVVITNSEFTKAAMQLAIDTDVIYCDRKQLAKLLENYVLYKK